ncbi:MAG: AAA family ATPase [Demequinaceae bacterium]|nr:AAA family ATPase [Demequinaceae bacterium]
MLQITHLTLRNWKNFGKVDVDLQPRTFLVGPNAVGKSNFLDSIRFLHDLASVGGGLQAAVAARGSVGRLRSLVARKYPDVVIEVSIEDREPGRSWRYRLAFAGSETARIKEEEVWEGNRKVLSRPDNKDAQDPERLAQTALEQVTFNREFREIAEFLASVSYLHLVPQLIREPDRSIAHRNDPYGGDFLDRVARVNKRTREARLRRIEKALRAAVPQLSELRLEQDTRGAFHLEGRYQNWRPYGARQDETVFSDGTLRLIGLLWAIADGEAPLLLEEPELSLHPDVVRQIPLMLTRVTRSPAGQRQVILSTHSMDLIDDEGIGLDEVLLLQPEDGGTSVKPMSQDSEAGWLLQGGSRVSEVVRPRTRPDSPEQIALF